MRRTEGRRPGAGRTAPGRAALVGLVVALGFSVAGCGPEPGLADGASPSASLRSSPAEPSLPSQASLAPTVPPATGVPPPPEPSSPTDDPRVTGVLVISGIAGAPGILGSYTLDDNGSDSPWLPWRPGAVVSIPRGAPVAVRFVDGSPIGSWSVVLADAGDAAGLDLTPLGGREVGLPPLESVALGLLPAGRWVLAARLSRADSRGDGTTYWSLAVAP